MLRKIRLVAALLFFTMITLLFLDFTGTVHSWFGWMAKIQFLPAVLALNVGVMIALVLLTLLLGRVYCSVVCPLGDHKSFVSFIIYTGNISWNPVLSEHSLLDKPIKERAAVFYCRPLVTYKDWVFSLILLLYPMILTTKEILKILIINLSSNLTYDILFSHLPSRKHYCHYCNHYIQHHNSIQNQIRNISSIM